MNRRLGEIVMFPFLQLSHRKFCLSLGKHEDRVVIYMLWNISRTEYGVFKCAPVGEDVCPKLLVAFFFRWSSSLSGRSTSCLPSGVVVLKQFSQAPLVSRCHPKHTTSYCCPNSPAPSGGKPLPRGLRRCSWIRVTAWASSPLRAARPWRGRRTSRTSP